MKKETEILEHVITINDIKLNPKKIECVNNFPNVQASKQIKRFSGLTGFF